MTFTVPTFNWTGTTGSSATGFNSGGSTGTTSTSTSTSPATGTTQADSSAKAVIDGALGQYGLSSLSSWAWTKWQNGESIDQIMLELRATPEYKTRFPAMDALAKSGHAISESSYIQYESSASQIFKAAGLPSGFYDSPDDFAKFLTNNVALPELQTRVQDYQNLVFKEPPEVLQAWRDLYGMSMGDALAYYIDPTKALPLIEQKNNAAIAAGWSQEAGFGQLNQAQAEQVGNMGLSDIQLAQQFGKLGQESQIFNPLVGTSENAISRDTAIGATFGANAQDQAEIDARQRARLATFAGGGGVATTQTGATGAGAAR